MKTRFTSIIERAAMMLLLMMLTTVSAWADGSGTPADPWISGGCDVTLVGGTLTVSKSASGNGAMADYTDPDNRPWNSEANNITSVVIGSDVTSIGANAFNGTAVNNYYINNIPSKIALSATTPFQIANDTKIHVFDKMLSIFQNATNWYNYKAYIVDDIDIVHVESIVFDYASMTVKTNTDFQLNVTINPDNARVKDVVFTTSNPTVVMIADDQAGTFSAVGQGSATITCTAADGSGVFAQCNITVNNSFIAATSVTLNRSELSLQKDQTYPLSAKVLPDNATYKGITWVSSDENVATVDNHGQVTAHRPGYATITAIAGYGTARATCNVAVTLNGYCGATGHASDVNYSLSADGVLTISGTGAMADYGSSNQPWADYRSNITSVVINEGVTHIGMYAFKDCNNTNLTSITIPASVESIGACAFEYCNALESITIPASVTSIAEYAFHDCTNLATVSGGDGLTSIGTNAFSYTSWSDNLVNNLSDGLFYLGHVAFKMKGDATGITFAEGTTQIYDHAFESCNALESIIIPASVTSIGEGAFEGCGNLSKVYVLPTTPPTLGLDAFQGCNNLTDIVVPAAVKSDYETGWRAYMTKVIAGYTVDGTNITFTTTNNGPLVEWSETVTLSYTGEVPAGCDVRYSIDGGTTLLVGNTFQMPGSNVTVTAVMNGPDQPFVVTTWDDLLSKMAVGGYIRLDADVDPSNSSGSYLIVPENVTVTLDLNDHTIDQKSENATKEFGIFIIAGALTLNDSGTGGTITGGQCGVYIFASNSSFTMTGGTITGNHGNSGGVYVSSGTFSVSGKVVITGNTDNSGNAKNLYLATGKVINVTGPLSPDTRIGVTTKKAPESETPVTFALGSICTSTIGDVSRFSSDNSTYYVAMKASNVAYLTVDNTDANIIVELSETQASMPALAENTKVVFRREFKENVSSTVCLPFSIDATQAAAAGKFYRFVGVNKTDPDDWVVVMQESSNLVEGALTANTPYLFKPAATGPVLFYGEAADSNTADEISDTEGWTFKGTYERINWPTDPQTIYGFAATNATTISPGRFFRVSGGSNSYILPFRAYLDAANCSSSAPRRTSASELPSQMTVRLIAADGIVTAIGTLDANTGEVRFDNDTWYDINGRRLNGKPSAKGLYINNGAKVVIK